MWRNGHLSSQKEQNSYAFWDLGKWKAFSMDIYNKYLHKRRKHEANHWFYLIGAIFFSLAASRGCIFLYVHCILSFFFLSLVLIRKRKNKWEGTCFKNLWPFLFLVLWGSMFFPYEMRISILRKVSFPLTMISIGRILIWEVPSRWSLPKLLYVTLKILRLNLHHNSPT